MEVAAAKSMSFRKLFFRMFLLFFFLTGLGSATMAQVTASIKGTVTDASGASVAGAKVVVKSAARGLERNAESNTAGEYEVPALPPGSYDVEVQKAGFETQIAKGVVLQVSQNTLQSFSLKVAQTNTVVTVESTQPVIDATTITVGQVIDQNVVQDIPLNGRHFVDLALLVPGTVTPPSNGFLTAPLRGQGSFAFNSAGGREDAVNFMLNGINLSATGSSGGLKVKGNSAGNCGGSITVQPLGTLSTANATVTADCTGGVIQSTTGHGIVLSNTQHVSLTRMQIQNAAKARQFGKKLVRVQLLQTGSGRQDAPGTGGRWRHGAHRRSIGTSRIEEKHES